jgi:hypothetical protein
VQPFGKFESQAFVDASAQTKDINRRRGGVNYYVQSQNLKFTAQCLRAQQRNLTATNEFSVQFQVFYF